MRETAHALANLSSAPARPDVRDVVMPRLSRSQDAAAIVVWKVREGDRVAEGDILADLEVGSVTMEVEAPCAGTISQILHPASSALIPAGTTIVRIDAQRAEDAAETPDHQPTPPREAEKTTPAPVPDAAVVAIDGERLKQDLSVADALRTALRSALLRDPTVFIIGESVADPARCSPVLRDLAGEFGADRVVGTPITPHAVAGMAVGAAMAGLKPVVDVTAWALMLQALDPIVQSAAKTRYRSNGQASVPLVLRGRNGAWARGGAMHSMNLASWFAAVPGLKVVCPATAACAKGLMTAAIADPDPVIILETEALYETVGAVPDDEAWSIPLGKARVARSGTDITIVTYGAGVRVALAAAEVLQGGDGAISAEVIDLRSLRPLDMPAVLTSVRKTGRLLTLDDATPICSISSEICAAVSSQAFNALKAAPLRVEAADTPVPYAGNLESLVYADAGEVAAKAKRLVDHSRV